jgi:hypothetical protein
MEFIRKQLECMKNNFSLYIHFKKVLKIALKNNGVYSQNNWSAWKLIFRRIFICDLIVQQDPPIYKDETCFKILWMPRIFMGIIKWKQGNVFNIFVRWILNKLLAINLLSLTKFNLLFVDLLITTWTIGW